MSFTEYEITIVNQMDEVLERVADIFQERYEDSAMDMANKWIDCPNGNFGGTSPMRLIECGRGHVLLAWIDAVEQGY